MITIGNKAPSFSGEAYTSEGRRRLDISQFSGKWKILLFYVADFSEVCPTEIAQFNGEYERFTNADAEIIGISADNIENHEKLVNKNRALTPLRLSLMSDINGEIAKLFDVFDDEKGKIRRSLVILDPDNVMKYFLVTDNYLGRSTDETYRALKGLQTGKACAVNWEPSE
jgi:alkyl hydroperoxide reductase subunit AhpC